MSTRSQIRDENNSDDIANFVHGSDNSRDGTGNFVPLFNGGNDRIEVSRCQCLLHSHQKGKEKYKHLQIERIHHCIVGEVKQIFDKFLVQ